MRMMHVYVKIYPSIENPNMKLGPLHLLPQLVASIVFISFGVVAAFCCAIVDGVFAARHIVSITKAYLTYSVNLDHPNSTTNNGLLIGHQATLDASPPRRPAHIFQAGVAATPFL